MHTRGTGRGRASVSARREGRPLKLPGDPLPRLFPKPEIPNSARLTYVCPVQFPVSPLTVNIEGANQPLSAGKKYELVCSTSGSRPPAVVTWLKENLELPYSKDNVSTAPREIDNLPGGETSFSACI